MAILNYREYQIYYEVYGKGKPLLILNGIMMSTNSWKPFIEEFSQLNQLILVDFLDQGKSSKLDGMEYDQRIQVDVVRHLIEELKLENLALFGISYGGEIAIQFATAYPNMVERCLFFNTAAYTSPWLKEIGVAWNLAASDPAQYYSTTIPVIYSPSFYEKRLDWMENRRKILLGVFSDQVFIQAMIRLTNSANNYDERQNLYKIHCPVLIVGCEHDAITPYPNQVFLAQAIPQSQLVYIPDSGHASMYEKPVLFSSLIMGFVNNSLTDNVI